MTNVIRLTGDRKKASKYTALATELCERLHHELLRCNDRRKFVIFSFSDKVDIYCNITVKKAFAEIVYSNYGINKRSYIPVKYFIAVGKETDGINKCVRFYMLDLRSQDNVHSFIEVYYPGQYITTTYNNNEETDIVVPYVSNKQFMNRISSPDYMLKNDKYSQLLVDYHGDIRIQLLRHRLIAKDEKIFTLSTL